MILKTTLKNAIIAAMDEARAATENPEAAQAAWADAVSDAIVDAVITAINTTTVSYLLNAGANPVTGTIELIPPTE